MDLLRLNRNTYFPDEMVNNWKNLVWTERFVASGDFQLVTSEIEEMRALIPEGSFVCLRDSPEVMMVGTHKIGRNSEDGTYEVTITGRSVTSKFADRGWYAAANDERWPMKKQYSIANAAVVVAWNSICNTGLYDVTKPPPEVWASLDEDILPNVCITDSTTITTAARKWFLEGKDDHYTALLKILLRGRLGIRSIRPFYDGAYASPSARVASVSTDGTLGVTLQSDISKLRFDIYNGLNRTENQSINERVTFHHDRGDLENDEYLYSLDNYKNVAWVRGNKDSGLSGVAYYRGYTGVPPNNTYPGWSRYSLLVDGDARGDMSLPEYRDYLSQLGETALDEHDYVAMYSAAISPNNSYTYLEDYRLGDYVTLHGDFGLSKYMRVNEYIRSEDENGESAYPTLAEINAA